MFPWHMKLWIFGCWKQAYSELWISSSQSAQQMFMESSTNSTWFVIYLVQRFWNLTSIGCTPLSLCVHYFPCNICSWGSMQVLCPHFVCILDPWDSPTYFEPFKPNESQKVCSTQSVFYLYKILWAVHLMQQDTKWITPKFPLLKK